MTNNSLKTILIYNENCIKNIIDYLDALKNVDENNAEQIKSLLDNLINSSDCLVHNVRQMPLEMGVECINGKNIRDLTEELIVESSGVKVDYIKDNWLGLRLPAIPPKRDNNYSDYLFLPLNFALKKFFQDRLFINKGKMILIYRFVYSNTVPQKMYLDYDNLEVKMITDVIVSHTTKTDHPTKLNNYYCFAQGEETHTEVFLLPNEDFPAWLEWEKSISKDGILM